MAKSRTLFWFLFLGVAVLLAVLPEFFEDDTVEVARPVEQRGALAELRSAAPATPATVAVDAQTGGRAATPKADLFAAHSWYVPPPPPSAAGAAAAAAAREVAPRAPSAPPMPFQYLGKLADGDSLRVFLLRGERIHTVRAGDVIDGTYRVERVTGTQMTLVYLPLNISQTLAVGSNL